MAPPPHVRLMFVRRPAVGKRHSMACSLRAVCRDRPPADAAVMVVDGDTLKVRLANGKRRSVRLIGIDTPEVYGTLECGGRKASASMRRLAPRGTRVVLVSDPTQDKVDRYGRLLRYVMKSGRDMNRAQVGRGWARVYVYNHNPFKRVDGYRSSQRAARSASRGTT